MKETQESLGGPGGNGCVRVSTQCVDVSAPLTLTPTANLGNVTTNCQGPPSVHCVVNEEGTACFVELTQKICISIPVRYGVTLTSDPPHITCADPCCP